MAVANVYTSQYGNTPQGQQLQSMSDALSAITGSPAAGNLAATTIAGPQFQNTQIPQMMSQEDKLRTMFANDQALSQKYMNPSVYGGSPAPMTTSPEGVVSQPVPNQAGYQGLTDPAAIAEAAKGEMTGRGDIWNVLSNAIQGQGQMTIDQYNRTLDMLTSIYGQQAETQRQMASIYKPDVVSAPDGFYLVDPYTGATEKITSKPGKWSTQSSQFNIFGKKFGTPSVTYTYSPPDGSAPSVFTSGEVVTFTNPDNPKETIKATVGSERFKEAQSAGWYPG